MRRRTFLTGICLSPILPRLAFAEGELGVSASPDLFEAVKALEGVTEGHGKGTLYILYSPWCAKMPELYETTRSFLSDITFKWIPWSGGQPEGKVGTEILLKNRNVAAIAASFVPVQSWKQPMESTPLADLQDQRFRDVANLIIRDTGRAVNTPTLIYRIQSERVRIHPGGLTPNGFKELATYISD